MVDAFSHCLLWVKHPGILVFCNPYFSVGKKRVIENLCCGICCAMLFTQKSSTMTIGKGTIQASVKWSTEIEKFESGVWHGRQILFSTLSRFLCGNSMPLQQFASNSYFRPNQHLSNNKFSENFIDRLLVIGYWSVSNGGLVVPPGRKPSVSQPNWSGNFCFFSADKNLGGPSPLRHQFF